MKRTIMIIAAITAVSGAAWAEDASFAKADTNSDGVLSLAESQAVLIYIWDEMTKTSRSAGTAYQTDPATGLRYTDGSRLRMGDQPGRPEPVASPESGRRSR